MLIAGLRTKLLQDALITAAVGQRIHPNAWPQGTPLPAVVIGIVSTLVSSHLNGASGLEHARVQFDSLAATRLVADTVARLLQTRLETDFRGLFGTVVVTGIQIVSGQRHEQWPPHDGTDDWTYLTSFDAFISYRV